MCSSPSVQDTPQQNVPLKHHTPLKNAPRIVVVGGGAGGLELVTRLGNALGSKNRAQVILIDRDASHLWKPLLHEFAVGAMDDGLDAVSYRGHAIHHHFHFRLGTVTNIDREARQVVLAPMKDEEGVQFLPETRIDYDYLVMALGSICNDFGTPGVQEHAIFLDNPAQARRFRSKLINAFLRIQRLPQQYNAVRIAIVGAGATGVELSAELHHAVREIHNYGFSAVSSEQLKVTLIEAGPRPLGALPERIALAAQSALTELGVDIRLDTSVVRVSAEGLETRSGELIPADIIVWAAGIKVPDFMRGIGGLETNRINQLVVNSNLQTSRDPRIFAIGDCAEFTGQDGRRAPPRAQTAHQMASTCYRNLVALLRDRPLREFRYRDHGSLVSLSEYNTVGNLMGSLGKGNLFVLFVKGRLARLAYVSLYRMHQIAIHGWLRAALVIISSRLNRWLRPRLKMH